MQIFVYNLSPDLVTLFFIVIQMLGGGLDLLFYYDIPKKEKNFIFKFGVIMDGTIETSIRNADSRNIMCNEFINLGTIILTASDDEAEEPIKIL